MSTLPVSINQWGFDVHEPGTVFGPRTLPDYDFLWVIDGEVDWEHGNQHYAVPAGALLLARPGLTDTVRWDPKVPTRNFYLHFTLNRPPEHLPAEKSWPWVRILPDGDIARPLMRHLAWLLERRPAGWEVLAAQSVQHLLSAFVLDALLTTSGEQAKLPPAIELVVSHVAKNWSRLNTGRFTLDELAAVVGASRESLCRAFRKDIGCAPIEALRLVRLERAATMLERDDLSVAEVASRSGFGDQFHFSRRFHDAYGCSPSDFRKRHARGEPISAQLPPGVRALSRRFWEELGGPS